MRPPVLTLLGALALAGCATTGGGKLAVCDGKHLRPANSYGSVLAPPAAAGEARSLPAAGGETKPRKLSSAASKSSFGSCA